MQAAIHCIAFSICRPSETKAKAQSNPTDNHGSYLITINSQNHTIFAKECVRSGKGAGEPSAEIEKALDELTELGYFKEAAGVVIGFQRTEL
ncbi:MAG TPA: hypothetical protein P5026_09435 [Kiritimatiellia bacterium]|nr:hypothetical protein [Kiritimatiellia bacterium]HRU70840.1 hypothetical protein [Kiritimatiellia bacterium]